MPKKLTQKEVEKRFKDRNLVLFSKYKGDKVKVKCKCFCGKKFWVIPNNVFKDTSKTCGCLRKQSMQNNILGYKHGYHKHPF